MWLRMYVVMAWPAAETLKGKKVSIENKNHNTRVGRADQPAGALQLGWGARAYTLHAQSDKKGEATHF